LDSWGYFASYSLYPTSVANDVDSVMPINPVSYTLGYEMIFYFVFALAFLFPRRYFVLIMSAWFGFIVLGALDILPAKEYFFLSVAITTRNIEFFYGCFMAYLIVAKPQVFKFSYSVIALILGLVSLLTVWLLWLKGGSEYSYLKKYSFIFFALPFSLIIFGALGLETGQTANRLRRLFIYLGDASYSIYLMHFIPIIILNIVLNRVGFSRSLPKFALITASLIVFGALLYRFVEKPLTTWLTQKAVPKLKHS
jgi:exopolysaccharide production protein ExoZ